MVVDHFGLDREVVDISFNYLDRYLSLVFDESLQYSQECLAIDRKSFQLISATALYVAIKLHGGGSNFKSHNNHLVGTFVQLSRGLFTVDDIVQMERELLSALQWHMNPPTSASFVLQLMHSGLLGDKLLSSRRIQSCANPERAVYEVSKFFTELAVGDYELAKSSKPFCIAAASIMNAVSFFIEPKYVSEVVDALTRKLASQFPITGSELASLPSIQLQLKELCPLPYNQSSAFLNGGVASPQDEQCMRPGRQDLQPNRSVIESISSPVSTSDLSHR